MPARRHHSSDSSPTSMPVLNGAPWYVKTAIWMIVWFGFPVFMCVLFFMLIVGYIPSPITDTKSNLADHRAETQGVLRYIETSTRLQRQICRNTAPTVVEKLGCDQ